MGYLAKVIYLCNANDWGLFNDKFHCGGAEWDLCKIFRLIVNYHWHSDASGAPA